MFGGYGSSASKDHEQKDKHDDTSRDERQKLPEGFPDAMNTRPDHQHDHQKEKREQSCHVYSPSRAVGGRLVTASGAPDRRRAVPRQREAESYDTEAFAPA